MAQRHRISGAQTSVSAVASPPTVQLQGDSALARWLLRALGWQLHFVGLPSLQGMFVVYPHTSNWDFVLAVIAKWSIGLQVNFWGKGSLFKVPLLGAWLRWMGGIPVLRDAPHGLVGQAVRQLQDARAGGRYCWFGLAPEGTRKRTEGWRSGFYRTALQADIPLCLVRLDYSRKTIVATEFMRLSGDMSADMAHIAAYFEGAHGLRPAQESPVRLLPADASPHQGK